MDSQAVNRRGATGPDSLSRGVAAAFGLGALSSGLVTQAISALALLFYNQVVGLSPAQVGLALMLSLICDAVCDPAIGLWSDNTRSPWGRRHPFMYAAILPSGLAFWLLWSPPAMLSQTAAFVWLLATLLATRICVSLYEVPSTSLAPELAPDYDARTGLISARYFCGVLGALAASLLAFQLFLADRAGGLAHRAGFAGFGAAGGALISLSLLVSTLGTHAHAQRLAPRPATTIDDPSAAVGIGRQVRHALTNRNFLAIVVSALLSGMALGMTTGLATYFNLYFWGLDTNDLSLLAAPGLAAAIVAVLAAPPAARRWGKKPVALAVFTASVAASIAPMSLRLLGLLPGNHWPWLLPMLLVETFTAGALTLIGMIVVTSMLADVVEDNAARTGVRSEGFFFAANSVLQKSVTGVGLFSAGLLLSAVHFPHDVAHTPVSAAMMHALGWAYLPATTLLSAASLAVLSLFRIDRAAHQANLARLAGGLEPASPLQASPLAVTEPTRPSVDAGTAKPAPQFFA